MDTYLYFMCYQGEALVASNLSPEEFGAYMAVGTKKHTSGNLIFFEIDPEFRSDYLEIQKGMDACKPHSDGRPRRSKYVSIYRVLEHLPLSAFKDLYLTTRDGRVLAIKSAEYADGLDGGGVNLYTELSPVAPRVVSNKNPREFAKFLTDPANPISVPRILFCDSLIEREGDGTLAGYLPYSNPAHIIDCIEAVEQKKGKMTKTVERNPQLIAYYRTVGRGFFLGDQGGMKFYPFPSRDELDDTYHLWWRSASLD